MRSSNRPRQLTVSAEHFHNNPVQPMPMKTVSPFHPTTRTLLSSTRPGNLRAFAAILVAFVGIVSAQGTEQSLLSDAQVWGPSSNGLRMAISPVKPGALDPKSAQFYVAIQNVGDQDVVLNLGNMLANGKVHRPDALHLLLTDAQGRIRELEFSDKRYAGVGGRMDDFIVALRSGATYILRLNLDQYWSPSTKEFELRLTPGRYTIAARFEGKGAKSTNTDMKGLALINFWQGSLESNGSNFEVSK